MPQPPPATGDSETSPQTRRAPLNKAMRQVHLPPVAAQISTFQQREAPEGDEDDEGIRYVDKLQVGTAQPRPRSARRGGRGGGGRVPMGGGRLAMERELPAKW